ncbi:glycosyl hydrolase family 3 protein [Bacteroides pyogenes F0041]|uniref:Glycosyl hydrolase family 3 protein n=1 Tax=Bacteroides pyogenes F0041 TaxID=1321819 RepID=U2DV43_9BACE|nr:glycoside hydrolase family 3 N-terminal domain-containing protein [Bacteroides pyogenes]ERI85517.1 glycosyl hydrolase family 3 protein [Bacteroides pyogenes F0041]MBB3894697.1 beta-glucosidase [Bacteroides pyogenes]SUV35043.1 putative exported hydrolase [Bacteroides pyogenes]
MIKFFFNFCVGVGVFIGGAGKAQQILPYRNPTLPVEERVSDLLARMTLEEKVAQISHLHSWHIFDGQKLNMSKLHEICNGNAYGFFEGFPLTATNCRENFRKIQTYLVENTRHGIPAFSVAESLHGVVHEGATIYPQNIALGSTFNPDLAYQKAKHIAGELNTMGIKQVLAPCIDVVRELRWGRVEESFGEDPFLCTQMGMAEVKGYMDHGISPMLKHYGPHGNPLGGLNLASVECGVRDLFDIYLKPFEEILTKTHLMAVMSSYNAWNRIPNSASRFMLTDILRNKYGFRGYVYSDWGVIDMLKEFHKTAFDDFEAASQALLAGLDVEASSRCYAVLPDKIRQGKFDEENVDQAVRRVLRAKFELGLFEDPYQEQAVFKLPLRAKESVLLSKQIADESTVLLKNEKSFLPLDINKLKSIAVIGPNADHVQFGDYTWSKRKEDGVTPLEGICRLSGGRVKINYAKGCSLASLDTTGIAEAVEAARRSDVAIVFVGSSSTTFVRHSPNPSTSGEGIDLHDISLTGVQEQLIKAVYAVGKPVVVVLVAGKPFAIPWVKKHIPAVLAQWYAGEQEGNSIADILFGKVNPSGRLTFSFPKSTGHLPAYYNYLPTDKGYYKEPGSYEKPGRDYVFSSPESLWAFGHGLSYTTFDYLQGFSDKDFYLSHDTIKVTVRLKNSGKQAGKEVVQIYVRDLFSTVMTPVKQLKGFKKVDLQPGEVKEVTVSIPVCELFLRNEQGEHYLEPGDFDIQVGSSSDCIFFHIPICVGKRSALSRRVVEREERKHPHGRTFWIEGSVRDVQGTPVSGVKIQTESSFVRVSTNTHGYYKLKVKAGDRLIFTKSGFKTKKVKVEKSGHVHVQMVKGD